MPYIAGKLLKFAVRWRKSSEKYSTPKNGVENVPFDFGDVARAQDFDATLISGFDRRGLKLSIVSPIFVASRRLTRPLDVAKVDVCAVFQNVSAE